MQFESNACESIKIGSLKARPSDCRLRPCMTARPRQACRAFSTSPSQPSSPLSLSLTYLSMPLLQKKQAGSGSLGAGSESVWWHGGACRGRGLAQAVGGWAGEQNQSQLEPPAASGEWWWRLVCSESDSPIELPATYRRHRALHPPPYFPQNPLKMEQICFISLRNWNCKTNIYQMSEFPGY